MRGVLIEKKEFKKNLINQCLLRREGKTGMLIICLYIDNTIIVGIETEIETFKEEIKLHFKTKEEGDMQDYMGSMIEKRQNLPTSN